MGMHGKGHRRGWPDQFVSSYCSSEKKRGREGVDEGDTRWLCSHPSEDDGGWRHQLGPQVLAGKMERCGQSLHVPCMESLAEGSEGEEGLRESQAPGPSRSMMDGQRREVRRGASE